MSKELEEEVKDKVLDYTASLYPHRSKLKESHGSGFVVAIDSKTGIATIATNEHVVEEIKNQNKSQYHWQLRDAKSNEPFNASLVSVQHSKDQDMAIIKVKLPKDKMPGVATFAPAHMEEVVYSVGQPGVERSVFFREGNVVATIGGKDGTKKSDTTPAGYNIFVTCQVEVGMSGGPTVNVKGEVIGINGLDSYPTWGSGTKTTIPMPEGFDPNRYSGSISVDRLVKDFPELASVIMVSPPPLGVQVSPSAIAIPPAKQQSMLPDAPFSKEITEALQGIRLPVSASAGVETEGKAAHYVARSPSKGITL